LEGPGLERLRPIVRSARQHIGGNDREVAVRRVLGACVVARIPRPQRQQPRPPKPFLRWERTLVADRFFACPVWCQRSQPSPGHSREYRSHLPARETNIDIVEGRILRPPYPWP